MSFVVPNLWPFSTLGPLPFVVNLFSVKTLTSYTCKLTDEQAAALDVPPMRDAASSAHPERANL
jgi:hypothetical protein